MEISDIYAYTRHFFGPLAYKRECKVLLAGQVTLGCGSHWSSEISTL